MVLTTGFCLTFLFLGSKVFGEVLRPVERPLPIGEMVSRGDVRFEARSNIWKSVEGSHFPIFRGLRIRTDKGVAVIHLTNGTQIEVRPNSLISFDQDDLLLLSQGGVDFRIPPPSQMRFKVGMLSILKSRQLQAAKGPGVFSMKEEESVGAIVFNPKTGVTVNSLQGALSVLDQDRVVLATVSANDGVRIPLATVSGKQRVMLAQAGDVTIPVGKPKEPPSVLAGLISPEQEYNELESYLIDISKRLDGYRFPPDLDAQKFFSILEQNYPNKKAIDKLQSYPVRASNEKESYVVEFCDKDHKYTINKDYGRTTDKVDYPYWRQDERVLCDPIDRIVGLGVFQVYTMGFLILLDQDKPEDKIPICP